MGTSNEDKHAYPYDLAEFACAAWEDPLSAPEEEILERLLSVCYQASLMREEERGISFRLFFGGPELLSPETSPPFGLQRLQFESPRPFDEDELRRLSPAASFSRSMIGVREDGSGGLEIWGIVQSGLRWIQRTYGGRNPVPKVPPVLVVHTTGPGTLEVYRGLDFLAKLDGGRILAAQMDVFASRWMLEGFEEARKSSEAKLAPPAAGLAHFLAQHALRRMISVVRDARHGATLVLMPISLAGDLSGENPYVSFKYSFADGPYRQRFRALLVEVINRFAEIHRHDEETSYSRAAWSEEYRRIRDPGIAALDEAIFEISYLIASLAAVDGAMVMSKRWELLGFGAEISGSLPAVGTVHRALDLEGERTIEESVDNVGTRHRSAYRLANAVPGSVVVVVSQDGTVRFIARRDGSVTYWEQA